MLIALPILPLVPLILQNPSDRGPDVFLDSRTGAANHPAFPTAVSGEFANLVCAGAGPDFLERGILDVSHAFLQHITWV